ncbi:PREDICTED: pollen-specific leucine-rich repeat extensin-like protein 1 [Thamnophis sirtalis]|uniref:Pollen-specific leucine-rich repeat extensin-like protein 1 n=1 Tax=Thamnophis sirtalis TaxID=35019 RepID=A0A6I9XUG4_9SAUR|nr:PREDICTED: pollen-specific leucine-rich repeat extensin-like protein 1 [Thamnophis sirtalis]
MHGCRTYDMEPNNNGLETLIWERSVYRQLSSRPLSKMSCASPNKPTNEITAVHIVSIQPLDEIGGCHHPNHHEMLSLTSAPDPGIFFEEPNFMECIPFDDMHPHRVYYKGTQVVEMIELPFSPESKESDCPLHKHAHQGSENSEEGPEKTTSSPSSSEPKSEEKLETANVDAEENIASNGDTNHASPSKDPEDGIGMLYTYTVEYQWSPMLKYCTLEEMGYKPLQLLSHPRSPEMYKPQHEDGEVSYSGCRRSVSWEAPSYSVRWTSETEYCGTPPSHCPPPVQRYCPPKYCPPAAKGCPTKQTYCPSVQSYCPPVQRYCPPAQKTRPPIKYCSPPGRKAHPPAQWRLPPVQKCRPTAQSCCRPPAQKFWRPAQRCCPPPQQYCPPAQSYCPPPQPCYPPPQQKYCPPPQPCYPPQQKYCCPPPQPCYPPQQKYCPPPQPSYPLQQKYCAPVQPSCPPPQPCYSPQQKYCAPVQSYCPTPQPCYPPQQQCCLPVQSPQPEICQIKQACKAPLHLLKK